MGRSTSSITPSASSRWPSSPRRTTAASSAAIIEPRSRRDVVQFAAGRSVPARRLESVREGPRPPLRGGGVGGGGLVGRLVFPRDRPPQPLSPEYRGEGSFSDRL